MPSQLTCRGALAHTLYPFTIPVVGGAGVGFVELVAARQTATGVVDLGAMSGLQDGDSSADRMIEEALEK
jgi:hypothetical protein